MATLTSMRTRARNTGFSLIELMIAMTLSLMVLAAIGWVYFGTMRTYKSHDSLSRMQESARYAFEVIGKDLRMIGAAGCSYSASANAVNTPADWHKNLFGQALSGAEQDGSSGETEFSDALRVVRADVSHEYIVQAHNSVGAQFTLMAPHDLSGGELMLATDCTNAAVFQASSASGSTVSHATSGTPGNSTINLGPLAASYTYGAGSRLYRLHSASYYVADNGAGPALFRSMPAGATAALTAEELVEGVEDMQVAYAVDTTPTPDGQADFVDPDGDGDPYLTAAQLDDAASPVPGGTVEARWQRVVSVRISLLIRTVDDRVVPSHQTYRYNGADVTATDLRLRKVFTHVIKVRNR